MGKSRRAPPVAEVRVEWRAGVHIADTPIWCDAVRAREVCFVSRADQVGGVRHGQLIGTAQTLALLRRDAHHASDSELSIPVGHPFTLGTRRIELFGSGSAIGSASLLVEVDDTRVVYAGRVGGETVGLGGSAELRTCDVLIIDASLGDPRIALTPGTAGAAELADRARKVMAEGAAVVAWVDGWLEGVELAAQLAAVGLHDSPSQSVAAHRSIHHAIGRLGAAGSAMPRVRRLHGKPRPGQLILWPFDLRDTLERAGLPPNSRRARVSGLAGLAEWTGDAAIDWPIAWSVEADYAGLIQYVRDAGAKNVFVTGRFADAFAAAIGKGSVSAAPLGPPTQLSLFR